MATSFGLVWSRGVGAIRRPYSATALFGHGLVRPSEPRWLRDCVINFKLNSHHEDFSTQNKRHLVHKIILYAGRELLAGLR